MSTTYPDKNVDDRDISNAIEQELFSDLAIPAHRINVETVDGIVTLSGSVDNLLAKERTLQIVESIKGTRAIVDKVTVEPVVRSDEEIRHDIAQALLEDPATDSYEVEVSVEAGVVTLTGQVDSWYEKELSEEVVKGVRGVQAIKNEIDFKIASDRSDVEIKSEVRRRMESDVWVDHKNIIIDVKDRQVTLSGAVSSLAEKNNAYMNAWVGGVRSVDDSDLEVEPWARADMQRESKVTYKSDEEIENAVEDAFLFDPRVLSFRPHVQVENGIVTLTGIVDNLRAKKAAEQDARNTVGVWRVKNLLKVHPEADISDRELETNVRTALLRDPVVHDHDFSVAANDGYVSLYGTVDSKYEKVQCENIASRVKGVVEILNHVTVDRPVSIHEDWIIKRDIENGLFWNPFVDPDHISVTVQDGIAKLQGYVDSWKEYGLAVATAYDNGASKVQNRLKVGRGPDELLPQETKK